MISCDKKNSVPICIYITGVNSVLIQNILIDIISNNFAPDYFKLFCLA